MAYVTPTTHVAGETLPAADWNVVVNDVIFLGAPPTVRVQRTSNQTGVLHNGATTITWQTDSATGCFDTDSMWTSAAPTLLTFTTAGVYLVTLNVYIGWATIPNNIEVNITDGTTKQAVVQIPGVATFENQYSLSALVNSAASPNVRAGISIGSSSGSGAYVRYDVGTNFSATWVSKV